MSSLRLQRTSLFILLSLVAPVFAAPFLARTDTREEAEASLLAELAGSNRPGHKKEHLANLEAALRPMYAAVPQEVGGTLSHSVVRYVLHRFFVQRGWFIRGLEPGSEAHNASSDQPLQNLQEWVPSFLQNFLEQLAAGRGISLRELAVLAATLEDLIHKESISRLEQAFHALELPLTEKLDEEHIREVLEVFMMIYMLGGNFKVASPDKVRRAHDIFTKKVKDWDAVQEWMRSVQQKVHPPSSGPLDFNATARVVEEIAAKYGSYNRKECTSLKAELLDGESQKAGRVQLDDFYEKGLSSVFEFNEKIDYLRVLGALDESDPKQPYVIVPNYVSSRGNCMVPSSFYSICCRNECEDLMGNLERAIAGEMAAPEQIISLVSFLSSETVPAPRQLSAALTQRLHGIAEKNGGQVPLHGRLFAQWMHHAFPRECPYPHEAGNSNPQTPDEWMQATGHADSKMSEEEMRFHIDKHKCTGSGCEKPRGAEAREQHHFQENELPWSDAEELLLPTRTMTRNPFAPKSSTSLQLDVQLRTPVCAITTYGVLISLAFALVWAAKPLLLGNGVGKHSKGALYQQLGFEDVCKMA